MTRRPKLFLCRKMGSVPNAGVESRPDGTLKIWIQFHEQPQIGIELPRSLARLLAKRITQALEE